MNNLNFEKLIDISNYILFFFLGNLYFTLCNLPFMFFVFFVGLEHLKDYTLFFSICLIPLGPAITALFYSSSKAQLTGNLKITKNYFRSYKENFFQSLSISTIISLFFFLLWTNINFFKGEFAGYFVLPASYMIGLLLLLSVIYIFPIISRFHIKTYEAFKLSIYLAMTKFKVNLGNTVIILFSLMLLEIKPSYTILFIWSISSYLLTFFLKNTLKSLQTISQSI